MKARESPMWAIASLLPVRSMTMVVLPMPARSALSRIALVSLTFALRSASSSRRDRLVGGDVLVIERRELTDDHRARDVARGMPAHAVGEHEQVGAGIPRVLVAGLGPEAEVGARGIAQGDGHRSAPELEDGLADAQGGADLDGPCGRSSLSRPMKVPLVEPRSSTTQPPRLRRVGIDAAVPARGVVVVEDEGALGVAADEQAAAAQRQRSCR